jgi:hypothetical protein
MEVRLQRRSISADRLQGDPGGQFDETVRPGSRARVNPLKGA